MNDPEGHWWAHVLSTGAIAVVTALLVLIKAPKGSCWHGLTALTWTAICLCATLNRITDADHIDLTEQFVALLSGVIAVASWRQFFERDLPRARKPSLATRILAQTPAGLLLFAFAIQVAYSTIIRFRNDAIDRRDIASVYLSRSFGFEPFLCEGWLADQADPMIAKQDLEGLSTLLAVDPEEETARGLADETGPAGYLAIDYLAAQHDIPDDMLAHAVETGDVGKVRRLLRCGLDPNQMADFNAQSYTLLEIARQKHDQPMVALLKLSGEKQ